MNTESGTILSEEDLQAVAGGGSTSGNGINWTVFVKVFCSRMDEDPTLQEKYPKIFEAICSRDYINLRLSCLKQMTTDAFLREVYCEARESS